MDNFVGLAAAGAMLLLMLKSMTGSYRRGDMMSGRYGRNVWDEDSQDDDDRRPSYRDYRDDDHRLRDRERRLRRELSEVQRQLHG